MGHYRDRFCDFPAFPGPWGREITSSHIFCPLSSSSSLSPPTDGTFIPLMRLTSLTGSKGRLNGLRNIYFPSSHNHPIRQTVTDPSQKSIISSRALPQPVWHPKFAHVSYVFMMLQNAICRIKYILPTSISKVLPSFPRQQKVDLHGA